MARYMASYGAVQSAGPHRTAVFRAAVEHAEAAAALAESNDFVLTVLGSAQHGLAEALGPDQPEEATVSRRIVAGSPVARSLSLWPAAHAGAWLRGWHAGAGAAEHSHVPAGAARPR